MTDRNRHGLSRDIPEPIAREVRQRDGFGCVVCGSAFIQYDHLDPPFVDAKNHDSDGIVLLCGGCHSKKTSKWLSVDYVKAAAQSPKCKQKGFSWGAFEVGKAQAPIVWLGSVMLWECQTLLALNGESVLEIKPPEVPGAPFRLTAQFRDVDGRPILSIVDNEWKASTENWDVELVGTRITLRKGKGDFALVFHAKSPGVLSIERISMMHRGIQVGLDKGKLAFTLPDQTRHSISNSQVVRAAIGIELTSSGIALGKGGRVVAGTLEYQPPPEKLRSEPLKKLGRNDLCFCGSSKKYKHCHGVLS